VILLDTNVLVYSITGSAPQHRDSRDVVLRAVSGRIAAALVPQIILEAYATVTSARRVNQPLSPRDACAWLGTIRRALPVKPVNPDALGALDALIDAHPVRGGDVFDLFLVAQMRSHGIGDICTYNGRDFALPGIRAFEPSQL
jgi:predicted nucleic acid-binding protein